MALEQDARQPRNVSDLSGQRDRELVRRALIIYGIGAAFLLLFAILWFSAQVFLLAFSAVLVAILLQDASAKVTQWLRVPHGVALGVVVLSTAGLLTLAGWLLAPQVADQTSQLIADLPAALQRLRDYLEQHRVWRHLVQSLPTPERAFATASSFVAQAGSVFSGLLGGLANFAIILFVSIYLAAQPGVYTDGIVKLLPKHRRQRGRAVLCELGRTLTLWLRGKLLSMILIGATTAIGLSLLGVPLALALGMVAGLLDFIPYLGPILAAIPAVLIAFPQHPVLALYVVLLFIVLQSVESYLLLPLVERQTVSLPPGLTITMQVLLGIPFGLAGVALATPLTAVIAVLIAMLYVQDVLGDQVTLPTEQE